MICPKCGIENPPNKKFCRDCGGKLALACPQCGLENLPEDKFRGECGHDLKKPKTPPPIDFKQPQSYTPKHLAKEILTSRGAIGDDLRMDYTAMGDTTNLAARMETSAQPGGVLISASTDLISFH
jgi:ribosomal protein L40E